ncbi:sensor domain-containing diguanylate cyclase [Pseudomarimonas salicorniae]|uniref:diguanylate cyclase n=1 Tax=Pseudomarimonas salicorniae TaxID=2933270 RepID=A0ABT0GGM0_9GAMM|nr:sensor domain-containing diguanylate cyclase [Lysobacter sp. CAU 1642]MCK7593689.1 sensor domain-containing diguanylate cyclase [Lysobacter sp. CAU 1642]
MPVSAPPTVAPFSTLEQTVEAVAELISPAAPMGLWMVTKVEGEQWIPLAIRDRRYGFARGATFAWRSTPCVHMVSGEGPCVSGDVSAEPVYAGCALQQHFGFGAYLGYPIHDGRGELFGTVCGFHPEALDLDESALLPRLAAAAQVITTYLAHEELIEDTRRRAERAELESRTDPMTGVLNRRGWELAMEQEQARIARTGSSAAVVLVDLDGLKRLNDSEGHDAGDAVIRRLARVLSTQIRARDVVGRLGGDEFAMLLGGIEHNVAAQVVERIRAALSSARVESTLTWSWAGVLGSLEEALAEADALLIEHKKRHGRQA